LNRARASETLCARDWHLGNEAQEQNETAEKRSKPPRRSHNTSLRKTKTAEPNCTVTRAQTMGDRNSMNSRLQPVSVRFRQANG
jgi:hypothetical protein